MYQTSIARFMFMTIFRSVTFVVSAMAVFYLKKKMETKEYEKTREKMVSSKSRWWLKGRRDGNGHT